jgi:hypothetical protein
MMKDLSREKSLLPALAVTGAGVHTAAPTGAFVYLPQSFMGMVWQ